MRWGLLTRSFFWAGWGLDCPKEATKFVSAAVCLAFDEGSFVALLSEGACASATGTSVRALYTAVAEFNAVACGHPRSFFVSVGVKTKSSVSLPSAVGSVWEVKHEVSPCPEILASIVHQSHRFVYVLGESASARYASKVTRGDLVPCRAE